jgi:phosphoribosyl 1,2-cyclic phosphodiesterase
MIVTLYGTRGSIAVANKESKKYGGNTTCLYVESRSGIPIIVDSGTGVRELGVYLVKEKKKHLHMIFTHYHWDHIQGFPFFAPLFMSNTMIEIYGNSKETTPKQALDYQMTLPYFPATLSGLPAKITFKSLKKQLKIGDITVETIATNHPNYTVGLRFTEGKKSFVFLTDNELFAENGRTPYEKFVDFVKGADFLVHDAQYTDELYAKRIGWGHSTYKQVIKLAQDAAVKSVFFTHHDHGSSDDFIDGIVKKYREEYRGLNIQAAADGKTIILQ